MQIGYARVSTDDQNLNLQRDALEKAGCEQIYTDTVSGTKARRPGLEQAFSHLRHGDTLVVWLGTIVSHPQAPRGDAHPSTYRIEEIARRAEIELDSAGLGNSSKEFKKKVASTTLNILTQVLGEGKGTTHDG